MKLKFPLRRRSFLLCLLALCLHFSVIHAQEPTLVLSDIQTATLIGLMEQELSSSSNRGKRVQVFGGSLSVLPQSETAKALWRTHLGMEVQSCGRGGAGFALDMSQPDVNMASNNGLEFHADKNSIQRQVWWYASAEYDIYVLWASTNDYTMHLPMGSPTDYTQADGYDEGKLGTQCGGMNYCIRHLRKLNPKAQIYIFGSLPFFEHDGGYRADSGVRNKTGHSFHEYVQAQREVAALQGIPFLDQFSLPGFDTDHESLYYIDKYHLTETGYLHLAPYQLYFLATDRGIDVVRSGFTLTAGGYAAVGDASTGMLMLSCLPSDSTLTVASCLSGLPSGELVSLFWDELPATDKTVIGGTGKRHSLLGVIRENAMSSLPLGHSTLRCVTARVELTTLPIVTLVCNDIGKEYREGSFRLVSPEYGQVAESASMRWRGESALLFSKKSFGLKFKENGEKKDVSLLGMRSDNNWMLDAMAFDRSRMRNRVSFELWEEFSAKPYQKEWEPAARTSISGRYVEVFLNDRYQGLYCLSEKMDRKQLKLKKTKGGIMRGLLYKAIGHTLLTDYSVPFDNGSEFWNLWECTYPDLSDGESIDWQPLQEFCHWLSEGNWAEVEERVDTPVWYDYFLFVELLFALDNQRKNQFAYFYDISDEAGRKLGVAPWDIDISWGRGWYGEKLAADAHFPNSNSLHLAFIQHYRSRYLGSRYLELREGELNPDSLKARFDRYFQLFKKSGAARREYERWKEEGRLGNNPMPELDFDDEQQFIEEWIDTRISFLDDKFGYANGIDEPLSTDSKYTDTRIYDLSGRPLKSKPEHGFYIQNGKKYLK